MLPVPVPGSTLIVAIEGSTVGSGGELLLVQRLNVILIIYFKVIKIFSSSRVCYILLLQLGVSHSRLLCFLIPEYLLSVNGSISGVPGVRSNHLLRASRGIHAAAAT